MSSTEAHSGLMTVEEFEALEEGDRYRFELRRGRLVREPAPGYDHGRVLARLIRLLDVHVDEHGLGEVTTDAGFILSGDPPTIRRPDLAFLARASMPVTRTEGFVSIIPDLMVEVISPGNSAATVQEKVGEYLDAGVRMLWLVWPRSRTVTVYWAADDVRTLGEDDRVTGDDVVPGFDVGVDELFP